MTDSPTKLCQVCATKAYKYTCPGCGRRTCSLDCSKAHKQETRCSGKRSKTHYIKLAHFTPNDMTSDYVFLEDAYRTADNATRDNNRLISETKSRTGRQQLLTRQCKTLGINIKFMPSGMKRHEQSQSIYLQRQKHILWTIELDFQECDKVLLSHRINESTPIRDIVALHVEERDGNAMTRHTLKPYCDIGVDALHVYLRKEDTPANNPTYVELRLDQTLSSALMRETIIEYPTLIVRILLPPENVTVTRDLAKAQPMVIQPTPDSNVDITVLADSIKTEPALQHPSTTAYTNLTMMNDEQLAHLGFSSSLAGCDSKVERRVESPSKVKGEDVVPNKVEVAETPATDAK